MSWLNFLPDFARGIHPPQRKSLAREQPIEELAPSDIVTIPLLQHAGVAAECVVQPRQAVVRGDLIARRIPGATSAHVHASVSGTVQAITAVTLPNGHRSLAVPIKVATTEQHEPIAAALFGGDWPQDDLSSLSSDLILTRIADAGIVGLGGATFPTDIKLRTTLTRPIETLVVNGCECEPYLTSDDRLMREHSAAVLTGARLARRACGAKRMVIAIEDNKPEAVEAMKSVARSAQDIEVTVVQTKYPMGGERQLIPALFQRAVPTGGLPLDLGIAVINVATAAAIAGAVLRNHSLTHRVVTVAGGGIVTPRNLLVPIGTSLQSLIDHCGGLRPTARRVLAGGPMMGVTVTNLDTPVTKGLGGVTVLSADEIDAAEQTACIRCGRCLDVCPLNLAPTRIALAVKHGDIERAFAHYLAACCECGCCAYECPARLPLVQWIRAGKEALRRR